MDIIGSIFPKFKSRLDAIKYILFNRKESWALIQVGDSDNIIKIFKGEDLNVPMILHGLRPYPMMLLLMTMAESIEFGDLVEEEIKFKIAFDKYMESKNNQQKK